MSEQIAPEVVEQMVAFIRASTARDKGDGQDWKRDEERRKEACAIVALLPKPADPDLIEAREQAAMGYEMVGSSFPRPVKQAAEIRAGKRDRETEVRVALAAIKRGRELERDGK